MLEELIEVSSAELVVLDYGIPHEVEAVEQSAFLLTISWNGGTKEERHAWDAKRVVMKSPGLDPAEMLENQGTPGETRPQQATSKDN